MSTADIEAIDTYIMNTGIVTPEAGNLQAQWKTWYGNLNFIDKALDSTFQEASNRRTVFNAANQQPEDLTHAADLTPARAIAKQAAIAAAPGLTLQQKQAAMAKNPTIPTTPSVPASSVTHKTIRQGNTGADVIAWQQIIGVTADGKFGPGTTAATKSWQTKHGLTADGIVGPKSWSAAIGVPVQEAPVIIANPLPPVSPTFPPPKAAQAPPVSPSPAVHEAAQHATGFIAPPIKAAISSGTIPVVVKKPFNAPVAAALVGVPTTIGGFVFGPVGAFIGAAIGAVTDILAVK